jgi:hypothetical protein
MMGTSAVTSLATVAYNIKRITDARCNQGGGSALLGSLRVIDGV